MVTGIDQEFEPESELNSGETEQSSRWTVTFSNLVSAPGSGTLAGALFCLMAALVTAGFAGGHTWRADVPLLFTVVLLLAALLFGTGAGVIGTVLSALVFATHLFNPLKSFHVTSDAARSNLGWMLLMGIAFSFLFAPQKSALRRE